MLKQMFKTLRNKGITKVVYILYIKKYILILKNLSSTISYKDQDEKV